VAVCPWRPSRWGAILGGLALLARGLSAPGQIGVAGFELGAGALQRRLHHRVLQRGAGQPEGRRAQAALDVHFVARAQQP